MSENIKNFFIALALTIFIILLLILFYKLDFYERNTGYHTKEIEKNITKNREITKNMEILFVTKVIDGDTIIANGKTVRLSGIDADEKNEKCYYAAKSRLEEILLNKEVIGEFFDKDKDTYNRSLRYIILNGENINLKMIKEGYVIARINNDDYDELFLKAEEYARKNKIGCKWNEYHVCNALNFINKNVTLYGRIREVYITKSKTYFNFESKYPYNCFVAIINYSDENLKLFEGKNVEIMGKVEIYKNKPQIILTDLKFIKILD